MRAFPLACGAIAAALPFFVLGHTGERGFVLLLPTSLYITGGALAVALSFVVIAGIPPRALPRVANAGIPLATTPELPRTATSAVALVCVALLVAAGFGGSRDPLANPLPLAVWTCSSVRSRAGKRSGGGPAAAGSSAPQLTRPAKSKRVRMTDPLPSIARAGAVQKPRPFTR